MIQDGENKRNFLSFADVICLALRDMKNSETNYYQQVHREKKKDIFFFIRDFSLALYNGK